MFFQCTLSQSVSWSSQVLFDQKGIDLFCYLFHSSLFGMLINRQAKSIQIKHIKINKQVCFLSNL